MCGRKCTSWERQKAGATGVALNVLCGNPNQEASLITNLHWRVSCPLPKDERSPTPGADYAPRAVCRAGARQTVVPLGSAPLGGGRRERSPEGTLGTPGTSKWM